MHEGNTTKRPQTWEDDPYEEASAQRGSEPDVRSALPSVDSLRVQTVGDDEEEIPERGRRASARKAARDDGRKIARNPWWRPESSIGRALLALCGFAVVGGVTTSALMLRSALERDNRFRIAGTANIQAEGLTEISRADLLPVFGEDIGKNIFFVHLDARRKELEAIPWVKRATVMRVLPDRIRVTLVERTPVAFTQMGGETGLVDAEGVLLTMSAATMAERHYSFPAVTGLDVSYKPGALASAGDRRVRMGVYMRMMAELDANGQRNTQQISEVDLSDPEDARVRMADQGGDIVAHLGNDHFLERYRRYMRHIGEWRQQQPRLIGVDLRYERQAVLQMQPAGVPMPGEAQAGVQTATEQNGAGQGGAGQKAPAQTAPAKPQVVAAKLTMVPGKTAGGSSKLVAASAKPKGAAATVPASASGSKTRKTETAAHNARPVKSASGAAKGTHANLRTEKDKKQKTERVRTEKVHTPQQPKHDEPHRVVQSETTKHKFQPAARPVSPAVEGQ